MVSKKNFYFAARKSNKKLRLRNFQTQKLRNYFVMKRIRILCSLLLLSLFIGIFQESVMSFVEGFQLGLNVADFTESNGMDEDTFVSLDVKTTAPQLQPELLNDGDSTLVVMAPSTVAVSLFYPHGQMHRTALQQSIAIFGTVLSFVSFGIFIYLIVLLVKIILSFRRGQMFNEQNIRRINIIGIGFLVLGVLNTLWSALNVYLASSVVTLQGYEFSYAKVVDWDYIIVGFVILLMNEVLRLATNMKKEQDLTI